MGLGVETSDRPAPADPARFKQLEDRNNNGLAGRQTRARGPRARVAVRRVPRVSFVRTRGRRSRGFIARAGSHVGDPRNKASWKRPTPRARRRASKPPSEATSSVATSWTPPDATSRISRAVWSAPRSATSPRTSRSRPPARRASVRRERRRVPPATATAPSPSSRRETPRRPRARTTPPTPAPPRPSPLPGSRRTPRTRAPPSASSATMRDDW